MANSIEYDSFEPDYLDSGLKSLDTVLQSFDDWPLGHQSLKLIFH